MVNYTGKHNYCCLRFQKGFRLILIYWFQTCTLYFPTRSNFSWVMCWFLKYGSFHVKPSCVFAALYLNLLESKELRYVTRISPHELIETSPMFPPVIEQKLDSEKSQRHFQGTVVFQTFITVQVCVTEYAFLYRFEIMSSFRTFIL